MTFLFFPEYLRLSLHSHLAHYAPLLRYYFVEIAAAAEVFHSLPSPPNVTVVPETVAIQVPNSLIKK